MFGTYHTIVKNLISEKGEVSLLVKVCCNKKVFHSVHCIYCHKKILYQNSSKVFLTEIVTNLESIQEKAKKLQKRKIIVYE